MSSAGEWKSVCFDWSAGHLVSLWEIMQQIDSGKFVGAMAGLAGWHQSVANMSSSGPTEKSWAYILEKVDHDRIVADAEYICAELQRLGCVSVSKASVIVSL